MKHGGFRVRPVSWLLQWGILLVLIAVALVWAGVFLILPGAFGRMPFLNLPWVAWALVKAKSLGTSGSFMLVFSGPIFLLYFGGVVYLYLFPKTKRGNKTRKSLRVRLNTHPVIVSGPFGVVTAAELLWITVFSLLVVWIICNFAYVDYQRIIEENPGAATSYLWTKRVKLFGERLGLVGEVCLGLLFIPVSRGSVFLRLVDIPFEHAVKYHAWLGHFTMTMFTVHGSCFLGAWIYEGRLDKMLRWKSHGIAIIPGEIALSAGLIMWVTSFQYMRIRAFELFYYAHQLYVVVVVTMVLHVGDFGVNFAFAGIFLFAFDRFLRFCQSRKEVGVLSATALPCGAFELTLPKPVDLQYNELSFVFLNLPSINWLQWHPFSVTSSPYDSPHTLKVLVKPLGTWTRKLGDAVQSAVTSKCPLKLKAGVEGPYGHESSYFLDYEALLLIGGGIGVSPFVAVIRDLLHRYRMNQPDLPADVTLIWAVKSHKELRILDSLHPNSIYPNYSERLKLDVKAYVTQETLEDVEEKDTDVVISPRRTPIDSYAEQKNVSPLVGSGHVLWVGAATLASMFGHLLFTGLVDHYYLYPRDKGSYKVVHWGIRALVVLMGMTVGIVVFGGLTIILWNRFASRRNRRRRGDAKVPLLDASDEHDNCTTTPVEKLIQSSNVVWGVRPEFEEIFETHAKRLSGSNVGVLVCGPEGMQTSVAEQCRAFNSLLYHRYRTAFNYHSVSFDL